MKKLTALLMLAVLAISLVSCDNRSQLEKDLDKAANEVGSAMKKAGHKIERAANELEK